MRFSLFLFTVALLAEAGLAEVIRVEIPDVKPVVLEVFAKIDFPDITETSGIAKSRFWEGVYWVHNDSGDEARIFAVDKKGKPIIPKFAKDWYRGVVIPDAVNIDWEDICTDDSGNLYIAATGNNENMRRDMSVYVIKEPYPKETVLAPVFKRIPFYFPEQKNFPPERKNFDCEAIFWRDGMIYLLTKHRSDSNTCLYRLDSTELFYDNPATLIGEFTIGGRVTGADCSADGKWMAALTTKSVWLFELTNDDYFKGKKYYLPIKASKCEAVCFDGEAILIVNEDGEMFRVKRGELVEIE